MLSGASSPIIRTDTTCPSFSILTVSQSTTSISL
nr:MAG TPA: hypothetical protein [Caudoviricetes sp.]